jgi:hypothetical protein
MNIFFLNEYTSLLIIKQKNKNVDYLVYVILLKDDNIKLCEFNYYSMQLISC